MALRTAVAGCLVALGAAAGCAKVSMNERDAVPAPVVASHPARDAADWPADVLETQAAGRAAAAEDWFEDVTRDCGVNFAYDNGMESRQYAMLESMGGGVAMWRL